MFEYNRLLVYSDVDISGYILAYRVQSGYSGYVLWRVFGITGWDPGKFGGISGIFWYIRVQSMGYMLGIYLAGILQRQCIFLVFIWAGILFRVCSGGYIWVTGILQRHGIFRVCIREGIFGIRRGYIRVYSGIFGYRWIQSREDIRAWDILPYSGIYRVY